jgi:dihydrofolate reductase
MAKITAVEYVSLDGVDQDPGPVGDFKHRGWTMPYWNDDLAKTQADILFASEAMLLGRVTYDVFAASWPLRSGDPFTDRFNSMPKFVASRTLRGSLDWNATALDGDVVTAVKQLKKQAAGDIVIYGSGELVNTLMQHKLIDVYVLMVHPLTLGSGQRYFRDGGDKASFTLKSAKATNTGVVVLTYDAEL